MITLDAGIFSSPARHSDCAGVLVVRSSHSKHCYAASWGIARSTNRKNRVLRVPRNQLSLTYCSGGVAVCRLDDRSLTIIRIDTCSRDQSSGIITAKPIPDS